MADEAYVLLDGQLVPFGTSHSWEESKSSSGTDTYQGVKNPKSKYAYSLSCDSIIDTDVDNSDVSLAIERLKQGKATVVFVKGMQVDRFYGCVLNSRSVSNEAAADMTMTLDIDAETKDPTTYDGLSYQF